MDPAMTPACAIASITAQLAQQSPPPAMNPEFVGEPISPGGMAAFFTAYFAVAIGVSLFFIITWWKLFTKAGKPGWAILIPIYNYWVIFEVAGKPGWYMFLTMVPLVNIYISFMMWIWLAQEFGKGVGFGLGLIVLPFIFLPILAFGSAQYGGMPAATGGQPRPPGGPGGITPPVPKPGGAASGGPQAMAGVAATADAGGGSGKKMAIVLIVIAILLGGGYVLYSQGILDDLIPSQPPADPQALAEGWFDDLQMASQVAQEVANEKPILLAFHIAGDQDSMTMKAMYHDRKVSRRMEDFVPILIDAGDFNNKEIIVKYQVNAHPPVYRVVTYQGYEILSHDGAMTREEFLDFLDQAYARFEQRMAENQATK